MGWLSCCVIRNGKWQDSIEIGDKLEYWSFDTDMTLDSGRRRFLSDLVDQFTKYSSYALINYMEFFKATTL